MNRKKRITMSHETVVKKVEEFNGNVSKAAKALGIPRRTLLRWYKQPQKVNTDVHRFVVTYAQNDTPVHKGFHDSLAHYLDKWKAELICFKGLYRNPTNPTEFDRENPTWAKEVRPYLLDTTRSLNSNLVIYPARTQPTAVNPLSGYDTHTGSKSGIFPHPKIRLKTVPTPNNKMPKILTSTGAITVRNYSKTKAGEKGQHHHIIGAVVVEVKDDKIFHIRHINADKDGSFFDIAGGKCVKYTPQGIEYGHEIDVVVWGDLHLPWIEEEVMPPTMELVKNLKPKKIYIHDVIDFWARNHHERSNRFLNTAKEAEGMISVREEIRGAAEFLKRVCGKHELCIVPSNHDEALDKWLNEESVDKLGINAAYFHWLSYHKHESRFRTVNGFGFANTLKFAMSEHIDLEKHNIRFLTRDVSEVINGIDYSMHGDIGPSGSRGSSQSLSKIGTKSVIAHGHSPSVIDGCYQVGVKSKIPLGYAKGPSGWTHTDCITYTNGKRTLIHYVDGEYCLKNQ